ncbi:MAG: tetratricopeptide repeat protein [Spirosomataceae bacterium]
MANDELKNIDDYFNQKLSDTDRKVFEEKLAANREFADEFAFYVHTKASERDRILHERHAEWTNQKPKQTPMLSFSKIANGLAAMLVLAIGYWYFIRTDLTQQTDLYIKQNLATLGTQMGDEQADSLEIGKQFYTKKQFKEAIAIFEKLTDKSPQTIEYLGLCYLQLQDYDSASIFFDKLETNTELLNNKGKFYNALVLIKQGKIQKGERLLKEVIEQNLGGKKDAEKILD